MKVYIVIREEPNEGFDIPLKVFDSELKAKNCIKELHSKIKCRYDRTYTYFEMEVK